MFLTFEMIKDDLKGTIQLTDNIVDTLAISLIARIDVSRKNECLLILNNLDLDFLTIILADRILKSPNNIQNKEKK